jgi:hypothetical protein
MAYFLQPYLNQAYTYFRKVIEHLTELAKAGKAPAKQKHTNEPGSQEARKPGKYILFQKSRATVAADLR